MSASVTYLNPNQLHEARKPHDYALELTVAGQGTDITLGPHPNDLILSLREPATPYDARSYINCHLASSPRGQFDRDYPLDRLDYATELAEQRGLASEHIINLRAARRALAALNLSELLEEQLRLNNLFTLASRETELWVVGTPPGKKVDKLYAAPMRGMTIIKPHRDPTIWPIVMDKDGQRGKFPRELIFYAPKIWVPKTNT